MNNGPQLELCWEKFEDLSITWNTIDVTKAPHAWVDWPLEWRHQALPPLALVVGAAVQHLVASRFLFSTQDMDNRHNVSKVWMTTGLWIGTVTGGVHVFNALDENGVSTHAPSRDDGHNWRDI